MSDINGGWLIGTNRRMRGSESVEPGHGQGRIGTVSGGRQSHKKTYVAGGRYR